MRNIINWIAGCGWNSLKIITIIAGCTDKCCQVEEAKWCGAGLSIRRTGVVGVKSTTTASPQIIVISGPYDSGAPRCSGHRRWWRKARAANHSICWPQFWPVSFRRLLFVGAPERTVNHTRPSNIFTIATWCQPNTSENRTQSAPVRIEVIPFIVKHALLWDDRIEPFIGWNSFVDCIRESVIDLCKCHNGTGEWNAAMITTHRTNGWLKYLFSLSAWENWKTRGSTKSVDRLIIAFCRRLDRDSNLSSFCK